MGEIATAQSNQEIVTVIRDDCGSTPACFESLAAWESSYGGINFGNCPNGDLVCANIIAVAQIEGSWSRADTAGVAFSGWRTGPDNYILVRTAASARHTGVWNDTGYRRTRPLIVRVSYFRIDGLQFDIDLARRFAAVRITRGVSTTNSDVRVSHSIFRGSRSSTRRRTAIGANRGTVKVWNNLFYGWRGKLAAAVELLGGRRTRLYAYNNTVLDSHLGFFRRRRKGTFVAKNNLTQGCDDGFSIPDGPDSDYNLSDLPGDAPGPHSLNSTQVFFADAANRDYRLDPTDTAAWNAGADLSNDPLLSFSDDLEGDTRVSPWDIGADEISDTPVLLTISAVGTSAILADGATISWNTSQPATSQVEYGTTTAYGTLSTLDPALTSAHSVSLSGLLPATEYHYRVRSANASSTEVLSGDNVFTTVASPDTTPPAAVTDLQVTSCTTNSCALQWTAPGDDAAAGTAASYDIRYSTSTISDATSFAAATAATSPPTPAPAGTTESFTVTGLSAGTQYFFALKTADEVPNVSSLSNVPNSSTLADTTPPAISSIAAGGIGSASVTITWSTSEPATSQVEYGTTTAYGTLSAVDATLTTSHSVVLTGLVPATQYHYRVRSTDAGANEAISSDQTFTTLAAPDTTAPAAVTDLSVGSCTVNTCTLSWTAPGDDGASGTASTYDLRYSTSAIGDAASFAAATRVSAPPAPSSAGTAETYTVTGLNSGTQYFFALTTADEVPNVSGLSNSPSGTTQAPPSPGGTFSFLVYGDSQAGGSCDNNADHISLVGKMAAESVDLTFHVGDMITGHDSTTNWVQNGVCTSATSFGSFKNQIAPLQGKPAGPGLATALYPVVGNHDDNWGSGWYPDPFGNGICDVFPMSTLVPNHTQEPFFRDPRFTLDDSTFYAGLCTKTSPAVSGAYPDFAYYSFDHLNTHFVVLHVNNDWYDLKACNSCAGDESNYDDYYNIHQLHWLQSDLQQANANPAIDNIVVLLHAPVFTSSDEHPANASWHHLSETFSANGVDLVLTGHNHVYERTVPIRVDAANPSGVRDDAAGTTYVVTGGGGSQPAGFNAAQWFDVKRQAVKHYLRITVDGNKLRVTAIDINGNVIDSFTAGH